MSDPVRFLTSMAQALATMSLYAEGHPARGRAADASYEHLRELQREDPRVMFSFLGNDVVFGQQALRSLSDWEWATRLANAGVQRLEFHDHVASDEYHVFLEEVLARISTTPAGPQAAPRASRPMPIRFGAIGVRGSMEAHEPSSFMEENDGPAFDLTEEADTVLWMHDEVRERTYVPLMEAEAVVQSLSLAMHGDSKVILPLLQLKEFDQYTTTHSLNVAVLSMGLAEFIGLSPREVRGFGVAGLLHDLGKVKIPKEVLTKPGKLTPEEWAVMRSHTVEGARLILQSDQQLDVAAAVAFEHHIMINGGGYPERFYRCDCHKASVLVHVCDVYDALRTKRPYRDAWTSAAVLDYIDRAVGTEFQPEAAQAFAAMMRQWEPRVAEADHSINAAA
jgi:putative nucleotidyltransferase with HDIG domain